MSSLTAGAVGIGGWHGDAGFLVAITKAAPRRVSLSRSRLSSASLPHSQHSRLSGSRRVIGVKLSRREVPFPKGNAQTAECAAYPVQAAKRRDTRSTERRRLPSQTGRRRLNAGDQRGATNH